MTLGAIATAIAVALAIPAVREALGHAVHGDTAAVQADLDGLGFAGVLLVIGLGMLHTIVWFPAEILDAAAGYLYGFGAALPLMMAVWLGSGLLSYYIGRHAARPLLYRLAGEERFLRLERLIHRGGVSFLLICRLVPIVPFTLTGLVAGAARVPVFRFAWTTLVGYIPITAYFVYVGSQLESFSAEDPILWIGAVVFLIAIFGVRYVVPDREEPPPAESESEAGA